MDLHLLVVYRRFLKRLLLDGANNIRYFLTILPHNGYFKGREAVYDQHVQDASEFIEIIDVQYDVHKMRNRNNRLIRSVV